MRPQWTPDRQMGWLVGAALLVTGCVGPAGDEPREPIVWALAIHGGAGTIPRDMEDARAAAYRQSLADALRVGAETLERGGAALQAVEAVVQLMEDDPRFNAGRGAVYNRAGRHELDAAIMDGSDLSCGAVAGVSVVRNPILLARLVMDRTEHVLLGGAGADELARSAGLELVEQDYYSTPQRYEQWQKVLAGEGDELSFGGKGTVGAVALDRQGHLAAATSTGGLTNKRFGRIGDTPIVGAGTFADDRTCAVSGTGQGEAFIRHGVARSIAARIEHRGVSLTRAAEQVVREVLEPGQGGVIAVAPNGELALVFNTEGMYRGAADSSGRFDVAIWDDP